jgi:peroxiredoxin
MGGVGEVKVGEEAPDFTLPSTEGREVSLREYRGKRNIVLLFYPLAWSPVCTRELCGFRDHLKDFEDLDAQVLGISVDSPFAQKAWAEAHALGFPLLSDFNREVCRRYGVIHEELLGLRGIAKRSVFLIDREGTVRYRWVSEDPRREPDRREIQKALEGLER